MAPGARCRRDPPAFDDCYEVLRWITTSPETSRYAIDSTKFAVGGTSVGGTVAIGLALKLREETGRR